MDLPRQPVSGFYGYDRGTPVDRRYIDLFLAANAHHIRGTVAEVKDDTYTRRFGADHVTSTIVIDFDPANPRANLVADLTEPGSLPASRFDCIVVTQTIQFLAEPAQALANCWQALTPGGALLLTAPTVGRLSLSAPERDYWRLTPPGFDHLLRCAWPGPSTITSYGNLLACLAMLAGYATEDLPPDDLAEHDPAYPLLVCASAHRPRTDALH